MKTRFCPSPTGRMHLGNARTALFNALLARHHHGVFLLRMEDTDLGRSKAEFAEGLQDDLKAMGLDWQEGPGIEGENKPYWQSQRQPIYDRFYHTLEERGIAYPCFCSPKQLEISRKVQISSGKPPRYSGTCHGLSPTDIEKKVDEGITPTLRFHCPPDQEVHFEDGLRGKQRFRTRDIGDFIIRRADGTSPFMFCNAIDDALMGVTHAVRGEDHLTNTPRQIMILEALGLPIPTYVHISLIVGHDGSPLSKRHGSRSVAEMFEKGYLPLAIDNYLARLGHTYENNHLMTVDELATHFSLKHLSKSPARFDSEQLLHWQRETIAQLPADAFWTWMGEAVHALVPADLRELFVSTLRPNVVFPEDALQWAQRLFANDFSVPDTQHVVLHEASTAYFESCLSAVTTYNVDYDHIIQAVKQALNIKGKPLYQPLRVALTGELHGPELKPLLILLGAERIKTRLKQSLELVS